MRRLGISLLSGKSSLRLLFEKGCLIMNEQLLALILKAQPPKQVLDKMWFHVFCQKFANVLLEEVEKELETNENCNE
jgi:predicted DNA-binding transcriptional regulator